MARCYEIPAGIITGILLALMAFPGEGIGQDSREFDLGLHIAASPTLVGLYRGDATVGSVSVGGWSLAVGIRTSYHVGAEVFSTFSSAHDDPYNRAPALRMIGGLVTASVSSTPHEGPDLYGGLGFTHLRIREWPDFSGCRIEDGCFREGGPSFENGASMVPLIGGGISYSFPPILVRLDLRLVGGNDQAGQFMTLLGFGIGLVPF